MTDIVENNNYYYFQRYKWKGENTVRAQQNEIIMWSTVDTTDSSTLSQLLMEMEIMHFG